MESCQLVFRNEMMCLENIFDKCRSLVLNLEERKKQNKTSQVNHRGATPVKAVSSKRIPFCFSSDNMCSLKQ